MTDTQNVIAPETQKQSVDDIISILNKRGETLCYEWAWILKCEVERLHRLPTQSPSANPTSGGANENPLYLNGEECTTWHGKYIGDMSNSELLNAFLELAEELLAAEAERDRALENEKREREEHDELRAGYLSDIAKLTAEAQSPLSQGGDSFSQFRDNEGNPAFDDFKPAPGAEAVAEEFISVNDLRQWQHDLRVDPKVRSMAGDAANEIERLKRATLRFLTIPAPAQGVTVTEEMVERLAMFYERKRTHPPPRSIFDVPINMRQRIMDDARAALQAALHPTPTPAQGVTDEAVNRAMRAVQKGCDITPREMRRALQAAFHPAEKE